jgi:hypothetical protein
VLKKGTLTAHHHAHHIHNEQHLFQNTSHFHFFVTLDTKRPAEVAQGHKIRLFFLHSRVGSCITEAHVTEQMEP